MTISVKQTEVHTGLLVDAIVINTNTMGRARARQIKQAVHNIRFFNLPAFVSGRVIRPDLFQYEITITEGDRQHTVVFVDDASAETESLRRLLNVLIPAE